MSKIEKMWKDPRSILRKILATANFRWMPDKPYLELMYFAHFGKKLDLTNPKTFNEKLQWLKLYDRKPEYTAMVDKYEAKKYVAAKIGEEYIIPTLGVWDRIEDIDFDMLPNQFVLKCTHDCGSVVICKDKSQFDTAKAKEKLKKGLTHEYFYWGREWPYKHVKRRIIAEKFMVDESGGELTDYKFMCFHGTVGNVFTVTERYSGAGLKVTFFDRDWNQFPFERHYPASKIAIARPKNLEKMIELAEKLSQGIPFVRVDFYEVAGKIYFGELTFFPGNGMEEFTPEQWDRKLGDLIDLSVVKEKPL